MLLSFKFGQQIFDSNVCLYIDLDKLKDFVFLQDVIVVKMDIGNELLETKYHEVMLTLYGYDIKSTISVPNIRFIIISFKNISREEAILKITEKFEENDYITLDVDSMRKTEKYEYYFLNRNNIAPLKLRLLDPPSCAVICSIVIERIPNEFFASILILKTTVNLSLLKSLIENNFSLFDKKNLLEIGISFQLENDMEELGNFIANEYVKHSD